MKHFIKYLIILFILIVSSTLEARSIEQNELSELSRKIQAEIALLKSNNNARPSPKLKELQKQARSLQLSIKADVEQKLKKEAKKKAKSTKDQILKYKKEIDSASVAALSTLKILDDGLDTETKMLQSKINTITDRKDVHQFLSEHGNDSNDAKEVRRLNDSISKIKQQQELIAKDKQSLLNIKSGVKRAQEGMNALDTYNDMQGIASNYQNGNYLDAGKGSLELIKKYLPDNSGKIKAQQEAFSLLLDTSTSKKAINKRLSREMDKIAGSLEKLQATESLAKGIDKSVKVLDAIIKMKKHKDAWDAMSEDGRTSDDMQKFLTVMNNLGSLIKTFSGVLPPGAKDFLDFYGDAMSLPGTFHTKMLNIYDRDTGIGISGPLANSKAIKEYQEKHPYAEIDKDLALNPNGALGVYRDVHNNTYVIITDPDKSAVVISQEEYDKIAQIASDLAAIKQNFTNSMLQSLLDSNFQSIIIPGTFYDGKIDIRKLSEDADRAKDILRIRDILSSLMSPEDITDELIKQYKEYERFIDGLHWENNDCDFSDKQIRNLFDQYQKKSKKFQNFVDKCSKKIIKQDDNNRSDENNTTQPQDDNTTAPPPEDSNTSGCTSDQDCAENEICSNESCLPVPGFACVSDEDCVTGEMCSDNTCVSAPVFSCESDADCLADEICSDNACINLPVAECVTDEDCAADQSCSDGSCITHTVVTCKIDSDCPIGNICSDETCISITVPECITDADCTEGQSCSDDTCITLIEPDCTSDADCLDGESCSDNICIMAMPDCISDADCPSGEICSGESCIVYVPECTSNSDCASDEICSNESCIIAPPKACTSDHDCSLDKICSMSNVCITVAGAGTYDTGVWDEREADRESEVNDRYAQDTQQELLDRFNRDDVEEERQTRIDKMNELAAAGHSGHSGHSGHHEPEPTTTSSEPSAPTQSSRSSEPEKSSSVSASFEPTKSPAPVKPTSTQPEKESKLNYYIVSTKSYNLQRYAKCHTTTYVVKGPLDKKGIQAYVKEAQKYANLRKARYGYPIVKSVKVTKGSPSKTEPKTPTTIEKCTPCPSGQHIGLDRNKQYCHGD